MKKGTNIGLLDVHLDPIAVGDVILAEPDGYYMITRNGFAQPVGNDFSPLDEKAVRPSILGDLKIIMKFDDERLAEANPKKEPEEKPKVDPLKERPFPGIANYDDQDLANELRRRGYKVIATKTTVVKL